MLSPCVKSNTLLKTLVALHFTGYTTHYVHLEMKRYSHQTSHLRGGKVLKCKA